MAQVGQRRLEEITSIAMAGSPGTVREGINSFISRTQPDELMVVSQIYELKSRLGSYEIVGDIGRS